MHPSLRYSLLSGWQAGAFVVAALLVSAPVTAAAAGLQPIAVASDLEAISPAGTAASTRTEARTRLLSWMSAAGLERIEPLTVGGEPDRAGLTGVLPGADARDAEREVVLLVTVGQPEDRGWAADARASALALSIVSELARVPRRHTLRLLFLERGASAREAAARWVQALGAERRDDLLAVVDLDGVGGDGVAERVGVIRLAPVATRAPTALRIAPGWLVHAALAAGRAVGEPLAVAAPRFGAAAQLLARSTRSPGSTAGDAVLAAGVPAVSLGGRSLWAPPRLRAERAGSVGDADRISAWERCLTAMVRRVDALDGRPRADGEYFAWLGRVWSRRDLYWVGLAVWILLVVGGLPGSWRDRPSGERSALGRRYLPGFAARGLTLVTLLALPVFSLFLLLPAAVAWIAVSRLSLSPRVGVAVAALPWVAWAIGIGWLLGTSRAESFALGLPALLLLGASFGTILWTLTRR